MHKLLSRLVKEIAAKSHARQTRKRKLRGKLKSLEPKDGRLWSEITNTTFQALTTKLRSGEIRAVDVLHAFQWKSIQADAKLNCVTEV